MGIPVIIGAKKFSFFLLKNLTLKRNNKAQTIINIKFTIYERSK